MISRILLVVVVALAAALSVEGFAPAFFRPAAATSTSLFSCRTNAKREKRQRNRENMRKYATPGRRGMSRRKILKKAQSSKARQEENEFIAKCFITGPVPNMEES
mmetsp:Transcript_118809/g.177589  ORF Transcript_118809/g.177589 Transcript_118809/m.177589 type:complete len:105 (+) Transcript_118809:145-459(+)|eukprot:CAMPEP_0117028052 /NCGR_PEP_ID=MMETSP0472-20121206/20435_1 /TAXON_ID=693140 ORGANISM="Tiarina fusus, Strain LIS" /NCGR_SAMPLE_ID=MMETSP0472 /ASSEMBLY_ACC=CAM_ASM_000603 /LENGTH=104 /DNA_ID=CAMNT_0004735441 /DNA_START=145 /DNA_END=459 /DNA_ORIENTATION=+